MKIQHYAIIFAIIILPFSIVCRNKINNKIDTISDEIRINRALDTATYDAIDTLRDLNDEFHSLYAGQTMNVTPQIAQEGINTFFKTLSVNNNLPFVGDGSYNKNYFSTYIPAIIVVAYDGFYVYSMEKTATNTWNYVLSPKIPYAYECKDKDGDSWIINFTLGNFLKVFAPNGFYYEGELTKSHIDLAKEEYKSMKDAFGYSNPKDILTILPNITTDMSLILYTLREVGGAIPDFLDVNYYQTTGAGTTFTGKSSMLIDYSTAIDDYSLVSDFHRIRRETIINLIIATLNEKMNQHNRYADIMGITYDFYLPKIEDDTWQNAINDVSIMAFVQGIPLGSESYYNSYALGASRIIQTEYIYGTDSNKITLKDLKGRTTGEDGRSYNFTQYIYHNKYCELIAGYFTSPSVGDANGDGKVNRDDSTLILKYLHNKTQYDRALIRSNSDVNGVDGITDEDLALLNDYIDNFNSKTSEVFLNKKDAAAHKYYPCVFCNP